MSTNASNCRQIRDRLSSYLDGELGDELRVDVDAHLEMCLSCRQQLQDLKELDDACRMTLGPASLVGKSRAAAAARLAERIESASWGGRDEHAQPAANSADRATAAPRFLLPFVVAAGAMFCVWLARPPRAPDGPDLPTGVGEVVAVAGDSKIAIAETPGAWRNLSWQGQRPIVMPAGARVRTLAATCELRTAHAGTLRLNSDSEVVLHSEDRVELVRGEMWCRGAVGRELMLIAHVKTQQPSLPESSIVTFTCPSATEVQCSVPPDASQASCFSNGDASCKTSTLECSVPANTLVTVPGGGTAPAMQPADSARARSWQLPLLHQLGEAGQGERDALLEQLLARIGAAKASYLLEEDIRALGPAGAPPLLAYARSDRSRARPELRRRAARIGCYLSTPTSRSELQQLVSDTDSEIATYAKQAIQRLNDAADPSE
ncbi:MAG: zf-HC2 domain-containing protein [Planctomycetales bacterium]|nr:zf-HC2 domain-containing protein [Planctomycetales bacterium]